MMERELGQGWKQRCLRLGKRILELEDELKEQYLQFIAQEAELAGVRDELEELKQMNTRLKKRNWVLRNTPQKDCTAGPAKIRTYRSR